MKNLISKELLSKVKDSNLNESVRMFNSTKTKRERTKYSYEYSVFLSHKHDEKEIIEQVIVLLNKLGVDVYLDWQDYEMPTNTNGSTAVIIKKKINENKKFIFLATEGAIKSKWCNWELGFGDALKYHQDIAVFPITDKVDNIFSGNEYLQIYPVITSEYQYTTGVYYVEFNGERIPLETWLKR